MKPESIRTTVNIPVPPHRRLRAQKVTFPLIASKGPKVHVTNEQIYEQIEFP